MYVLRGVSRWLAVICMLGLAASFTGCSKKSPSDSGGKSPDAKTTEVGTGHNGGGPRQTIDNDGKSPVKAKSPTQPKSNGGDPGKNGGGRGKTNDNDGKSPAKAKKPTEAKANGGDPIPDKKDESGSGLKNKIRGPKLGSGR